MLCRLAWVIIIPFLLGIVVTITFVIHRHRYGGPTWWKHQWRRHDDEYKAIIDSAKRKGLLMVMLLLLSACAFPAWRDQAYQDLLAGRLHLDYSQVSPGGAPSSYLDFYDRGGRRLGYGVIRGESIDLYGADGSRAGYGRGR